MTILFSLLLTAWLHLFPELPDHYMAWDAQRNTTIYFMVEVAPEWREDDFHKQLEFQCQCRRMLPPGNWNIDLQPDLSIIWAWPEKFRRWCYVEAPWMPDPQPE